jgi:hypothetical protein
MGNNKKISGGRKPICSSHISSGRVSWHLVQTQQIFRSRLIGFRGRCLIKILRFRVDGAVSCRTMADGRRCCEFYDGEIKNGSFSDSDPKSSAPATEGIDRLETESSTQNLYLCMSDRCEESFDTVQIPSDYK